jgi:hypothetical protein
MPARKSEYLRIKVEPLFTAVVAFCKEIYTSHGQVVDDGWIEEIYYDYLHLFPADLCL